MSSREDMKQRANDAENRKYYKRFFILLIITFSKINYIYIYIYQVIENQTFMHN